MGTQRDSALLDIDRTPGVGSETIRWIRIRLARALSAARPDDEEVIAQLQLALEEPQASPPDSEIHFEIGNVFLTRRDRAGALKAFVHAVATAPGAGGPASKAALALLAEDGQGLAGTLAHSDYRALMSAVLDCPVPAVSDCLLAGRLNRARGDVPDAIRALSVLADRAEPTDPIIYAELAGALIEDGRPEQAFTYLDRIPAAERAAYALIRAWALLDCGRFSDARLAADNADPHDCSASVISALARFGLGEHEEALQTLLAETSRREPSRDAALAEAVIRLHLASLDSSSIFESITAANDLAIIAARLEPANADVLLVRAQIQLEGCLDVDEGRRLLQSAVDRKGASLERSRWLQVQNRARVDNGWFQYFRTELAAALRDDDRVLEQVGAIDRSETAWGHDAALETLAARVHERRLDLTAAADSFQAAAAAYNTANDLPRAAAASRKQFEYRRTPQAAFDLAEYLWRLAYLPASVDQVETTIAEALEALKSVENAVGAEQVARATVLRGLFLFRRSEVTLHPRPAENWLAVPWLLLAHLLRPSEPIWSAHLAWALDLVNARRAALYFAELGYAPEQTDTYPQETLIAMRFNYFGHLDAATEELARGFTGDRKWLNSVLLQSALVDGRLGEWAHVTPDDLFDSAWSRETFARYELLVHGAESDRETLRKVGSESEQPPCRWTTASDMALLLGEPDRAREIIRNARASGELAEDMVAYNLALIDLMTSQGERGFDAIAAYLASRRVPNGLRVAANIELGMLHFAPGCSPAVATVLDRLIEIARAHLERVEAQPLPALITDASEVPDAEPRELVTQLLHLEQLRATGSRQPSAAARVRRLARTRPDGLLGVALRQLEADYSANLTTAARHQAD